MVPAEALRLDRIEQRTCAYHCLGSTAVATEKSICRRSDDGPARSGTLTIAGRTFSLVMENAALHAPPSSTTINDDAAGIPSPFRPAPAAAGARRRQSVGADLIGASGTARDCAIHRQQEPQAPRVVAQSLLPQDVHRQSRQRLLDRARVDDVHCSRRRRQRDGRSDCRRRMQLDRDQQRQLALDYAGAAARRRDRRLTAAATTGRAFGHIDDRRSHVHGVAAGAAVSRSPPSE